MIFRATSGTQRERERERERERDREREREREKKKKPPVRAPFSARVPATAGGVPWDPTPAPLKTLATRKTSESECRLLINESFFNENQNRDPAIEASLMKTLPTPSPKSQATV